MNTKLGPLTSYTSPNPHTTTHSSSITKLTLKPRTRLPPTIPWQQPNQYKPPFTNTSLSNSLASVIHPATNHLPVFHNTHQQLICVSQHPPTTDRNPRIQTNPQPPPIWGFTTTHNTHQQLIHNPRIQPTHHPNCSCCLHSSIKAPWSSLRTRFRPIPFQSTQSAGRERSKRGRVRINKFLELKVVVHGGLWVEGRERVYVKGE